MDVAVEAFVASDYAEAGKQYEAAVNEAEEANQTEFGFVLRETWANN